MVDTRITDNIFENSAQQTDALTLAEQVLTFWHFWLPGVTPDECQGRALAASTLRGLIEKERSIPIGDGPGTLYRACERYLFRLYRSHAGFHLRQGHPG